MREIRAAGRTLAEAALVIRGDFHLAVEVDGNNAGHVELVYRRERAAIIAARPGEDEAGKTLKRAGDSPDPVIQ